MARRVLFGSYELVERIGEGGMAEVWRALSRGVAGFEKTVVLKRVLPTLMARQDFASLLIREAKIAALLNHPNIVQIFELGEEDGAYFIAMEYVHGCDLASALAYQPDPLAQDASAGLSLPLRIWIVQEAAKALDYAHRRVAEDGRPLSIVHRDISPQNVLLGYEGQVKVADFGIALADERGLGKEEDPTMLRGKYGYMSPEQVRGEVLDNRSDIFSLGIVLHELLSGKRLFWNDNRNETLRRVEAADVPPIDAAALGAPPLLAEVVGHALNRERERRYAAAGDMAEHLAEVLQAMGAHVDNADLTQTLLRIAPPEDGRRVNKLRFDLKSRAANDATVSGGGLAEQDTPVVADATRIYPTSRQIRAEARSAVVLLAREIHVPATLFAEVVRNHGGIALPPSGGIRDAVFGHTKDLEHAASLAADAALDLRSRGSDAPMVVLPGVVRVIAGDAVEPGPRLRERGLQELARLESSMLTVDPALREDLSWRFRLEDNPTSWPLLTGYLARSERWMGGLRRGPLIGRSPQMQRLRAALAAAAAGQTQALMLLGSAGAGKSRLLAELRATKEAQESGFFVSHGQETSDARPFGGFHSLFSDLCGIDEDDDGATRASKVQRLRVLGLTARELDYVGQLLGAPMEPAVRIGRPRGIELLVAARRAVRAIAADVPVVLCFEDVHYMDDETRQLLDTLVSRSTGGSCAGVVDSAAHRGTAAFARRADVRRTTG